MRTDTERINSIPQNGLWCSQIILNLALSCEARNAKACSRPLPDCA